MYVLKARQEGGYPDMGMGDQTKSVSKHTTESLTPPL